MAAPNTYSLLADIGGTNTRVALAEGKTLLPETIRRYRNAAHSGIEEVLQLYLAESGRPDCAGACVAAAGPVRNGGVQLTNLGWEVTGENVARAARAETVAVLNDLQAQGHALGYLDPSSLTELVPGAEAGPLATKLVVGIGTGFNIAPVYETGTSRFVPPAEAGHVSLPVSSLDDMALAEYLRVRHDFASVEEALSGRGLENLYAWHGERSGAGTGPRHSSDIMIGAESGNDPVARSALRSFVTLFGTVAGDLALTHLPFGGLYLVGGMSRAVAPWMSTFAFADSFRQKGRFSRLMSDFPVHLVDDDYAALTGCAHHLAHLIGQSKPA